MSEREQQFIDRWRTEADTYFAWGNFVADKVRSLVRPQVAPMDVDLFLRLPAIPRLKTEDSLLQKAFFRGKEYSDPYGEIEDKVGVRFVVLVSTDIRRVEAAILEGSAFWEADKARDFLEEQDKRPYEFDYQSLHYVVRSKVGMSFGDIVIPADLPCEIQVRTILQHAYSELTHDTLYKPKMKATPSMKRAAAKSMALIEATDDYFRQLTDVIEKATENQKKLLGFLAAYYEERVGAKAEESPLNAMILDHYQPLVEGHDVETISAFLDAKPFIAAAVRSRHDFSVIYRMPAVFLLYYCVGTSPNAAKQDSPLTDAELEPVYSDLGLTIQG